MVDLFSRALDRSDGLLCLEDNTQCIDAVRTGYSAAPRHIALSIAHEQFFGENVNFTLLYEGRHVHQEASSRRFEGGILALIQLGIDAPERPDTWVRLPSGGPRRGSTSSTGPEQL